MQTLFNKSPSSERGVVISPAWSQARSGLSRNLQQALSYYHTRTIGTRSTHLLVRMLNSMRVNLDAPLERYYELVDTGAPYMAMGLKLTNSIHQGVLHDGVFYGDGVKEIIVGNSEPFDVYAIAADWKNATPVKILDHCKTDLDMHIPNGVAYSGERGYAVISVNITMMAIMWRCFLIEQRALLQRGQTPKTTPMFVHAYVLANAIPSHLDVALLNRMIAHIAKNPLKQPSRRNPFALGDHSMITDKVLRHSIEHLQTSGLSLHDMLCNIPTVTASNAAEAMQLPAMAPTRQYAWAEVVARIKVVAAMAALSPSRLKEYDKSNLQYMIRMIDYSNMRQVITAQMKTDAPVILEMLDAIEMIASSS